MKFKNLLQPIILGNIKIPNRLYFSAMGIGMAKPDQSFSDELFDFYSEIINGQCKLIFLANATISKYSKLGAGGLGIYNQQQANSFQKIIQKGEDLQSIVAIQLQHYGIQGLMVENHPLLTPSGENCIKYSKKKSNQTLREMSIQDIKNVIKEFTNSAILAHSAGAKIIQLQASNGYLLSSFLSPYTNSRTDEYGGSELNRARILLEIVSSIKQKLSDKINISVRLGIDDRIGKEGLLPHMLIDTICSLKEAGVCTIECSICVNETFGDFIKYSQEMENYLHKAVKFIKTKSPLPIGFSGFVDSLQKADFIIEQEIADFVGMTRALFADNELIIKTLRGNEKLINKCLWDGNCFKDKSNSKFNRVYCCVNPKYLRPN